MSQNPPTTAGSNQMSAAIASRLRELLDRFDPTMLGFLGLLSLPADVFDSLAVLDLFGIFFLFFLWMFIGPLVDAVLTAAAGADPKPTDWLDVGGVRGLLMLPLTFLNPLVLAQDVLQIFGGVVTFVRHRGSLPDAASYDQQTDYRLPVEGTWTVINGSPEQNYSHSWIYPNQRYAYDVVITDEDGRSRPEDADTGVEEYYCYNKPVLAPADGVVVDAFDAALESARAAGVSHPLKRSMPGGHVVIRHADSEYSCLAHLRPGSVPVEPGDRVTRGQEVGRCGHSGNSSEPHLHFQIQDRPDFFTSASLPVQFDDVVIESPGTAHDPGLVPGHDVWHSGTGEGGGSDPSPEGQSDDPPSEGHHDRTFVIAGQRVTHDDRSSGRENPGESQVQVPGGDRSGVPANSTGRQVTGVLRRAAFGVAAAGLLTFAGNTLLSGYGVALLLGGAAVAGVVFRYGFAWRHGDRFQGRTGSAGASLGLALASLAVAVATGSGLVGVGTLVGVFLLAGGVWYALVAEYNARWLRVAGRHTHS